LFDIGLGYNDGMSDAKWDLTTDAYRRMVLVGGRLLSFCDRYQRFEEFWYFQFVLPPLFSDDCL
jgi:hypothetical protein